MELTPNWEFVADAVMGGVSTGEVRNDPEGTRLTGRVSLDNNGGFVQMAFNLADGAAVDVSAWDGLEIDVCGNGEVYDMRLRTDQLKRPWESYRASFLAEPEWRCLRLPFSGFHPHRTEIPLDLKRLRRIGVLAIGRAFDADVTVRAVRFYRSN